MSEPPSSPVAATNSNFSSTCSVHPFSEGSTSSTSSVSTTSSEETCPYDRKDGNKSHFTNTTKLRFISRSQEQYQRFLKEQQESSWTTTTEEDDENGDTEDSTRSQDSFQERTPRSHRKKSRHKKNPFVLKSRTPSPVLLVRKQGAVKPGSSSSEGRGRNHYQLPLRTQIRLLIERALVTQLQENCSPNPKRNWFRRQIDTFFLLSLVFIMKYHRELFLVFLVWLSSMASLRTSPMKTRPTPDPTPFFDNPVSLQYIDDFYKGEYMDLVKNKINLGPAFVFYYAPWDSESVAARNVFVNVARYFRYTLPHRIRFYAVNCWWPQGECRKNYKNLSHFPIFVAHVERNMGIIYSGPIRAELIIKFLSSILKPLHRIDTEDELWRFRAQHDAIMLGYFNFTRDSDIRDYETYRQMALRSYETDPFGQIGYGMFLRDDLAIKYFLTSSNVISLVLFNEIHTAKWSGDGDAAGSRGPVAQVSNWVIERTKKTPITWAYQVRTGFANRAVALGPMDFFDELSKGPVMLLITRRYFPSSYSPFYAQVKEVALDYFNCNKSGNVTRLKTTTHQINSEWMTLWNSISKICAAQVGPPTDTCILLKDQLKHWMAKRSLLKRESLASYKKATERMNFTGFSCASDRQFKFFAIDPIDMPYFIPNAFGGLGFHNDSDPVLFIIDAQNDMILPFSNINITQIAEVIYNYSNDADTNEDGGNFVSSFWSSPHISRVQSHSSNIEQGKNLIRPTQSVEAASRHNLVMNMNSEDLERVIKGIEPFHLPTPMFLMYTAKFCGTCGIALTSFVDLSRFMEDYYHIGVNITFAKMNMVQNSVPMNLSPDRLPTFVFFPGNDRTDYRVFPGDEKITSKTLLQFLLSELDSESRIKLSLQSPGCSASDDSYCGSADSKHEIRRHQAECVTQENNNKTNLTSREHCISTNKHSVVDKLQLMFDEIRQGRFSEPQPHLAAKHLGVNMDYLKTQDLNHLRAMKITLDGI